MKISADSRVKEVNEERKRASEGLFQLSVLWQRERIRERAARAIVSLSLHSRVSTHMAYPQSIFVLILCPASYAEREKNPTEMDGKLTNDLAKLFQPFFPRNFGK
jgi:hypothetical protein